MNERWQPTPRDRFILRCVGGCLGGSVLLTLVFILILIFVMNPAAVLMQYPVAALLSIIAVAAFVTSGVCLSKLGRSRNTSEPRRLWRISLLCHVGIVAIAATVFGPALGLTLGIMELMAIGLHVYALAAPNDAHA